MSSYANASAVRSARERIRRRAEQLGLVPGAGDEITSPLHCQIVMLATLEEAAGLLLWPDTHEKPSSRDDD